MSFSEIPWFLIALIIFVAVWFALFCASDTVEACVVTPRNTVAWSGIAVSLPCPSDVNKSVLLVFTLFIEKGKGPASFVYKNTATKTINTVIIGVLNSWNK